MKIVPLSEARAGDILIYKGSGIIYEILSRLIKRFKAPEWDRWGWHMEPVVYPGISINATWPKLQYRDFSKVNPATTKCYRIMETEPPKEKTEAFIKNHIGEPYDIIVYLWTGLAVLFRPHFDFPRIISKSYTCWETTWDAMEYWNYDMDPLDYNYPFITDFLQIVGAIT